MKHPCKTKNNGAPCEHINASRFTEPCATCTLPGEYDAQIRDDGRPDIYPMREYKMANDRETEARDVSKYRSRGHRAEKQSGVSGVAWHKKSEHWESSIFIRPKKVYLGRSKSLSKAVMMRYMAEVKAGRVDGSMAQQYVLEHGMI